MSKSSAAKVMIVHLYGVYYPERQDYARYLDWVAEQITKTEVSTVILTGGFTVPSLPDVSEASSAQQYLSRKISKISWLLEDGSFTTYQNTNNAAKLLKTYDINLDSVYVLSDHARQAKAIWLALTLLLEQDKKSAHQNLVKRASRAEYDQPFSFENLTVLNYAYSPKLSTEALHHTYYAIIDALPVFDPALDEIATQQRRLDFGFDS